MDISNSQQPREMLRLWLFFANEVKSSGIIGSITAERSIYGIRSVGNRMSRADSRLWRMSRYAKQPMVGAAVAVKQRLSLKMFERIDDDFA